MENKEIEILIDEMEELEEKLLSMSEEIWRKVDPIDTSSVIKYTKILQSYNIYRDETIKKFELIKNIFKQTFEIGEIILGPVHDPQRWHSLSESFTFKKPTGYSMEGFDDFFTKTWRELYKDILSQLYHKHSSEFNTILDNPQFITYKSNVRFSQSSSDFIIPYRLGINLFTELNYSANDVCRCITSLLQFFGYDPMKMKIFLRD